MELAITKYTQVLERLEGIITRNLQSFYEVGRALMEIRDKGLYRDVLGYETFEAYCKARWSFTRQTAYQFIDSARVIENVSDCLQRPANEYQTRPLARLEPDQQREAWQKAVETAPEGKVTAAHVSKVVKEITGEQAKAEARENGEIATATRVYHLIKDTPKANRNEDSDALFHLKRWWKKTTKKDRRVFIEWTKEEGL